MNKDVIYIDVEDDITAIIGKLKDSKEKIVALVPPKRIGVLQSAVNLRLLDRAARTEKKHLVLITNNAALIALAAPAKIPVAKTLQSKPELPEIAALEMDDGDDIIDGANLPVGELAKTADKEPESDTDKAAASLINAAEKTPADVSVAKKTRVSSGAKVPNFNAFRKKLFLGIGAGVALVAFLVWAIGFAPRATVVITARTTDTAIQDTVALSQTSPTDASKKILHVEQQEKKDTQSIDFTPTGTKNVGEKATGTVTFSSTDFATVANGTTIPAGTQLSDSNGNIYLTDDSATINASNYPDGASVGITASERGSKYNGATGSVSGAPDKVNASITTATSGGTDKTAKVVTASDVQTASQKLADKLADDATMKAQLKSQFGADTTVIDDSFAVDKASPKSSPAVGAEADGNATLSVDVTYTIFGVSQSELSSYLDVAAKNGLDDLSNQRVYDNGSKDVRFDNVKADAKAPTAQLTATAKLGPEIKDDDIKDKVKGKRLGDIQADLQSISGVDNVDVKFWPFWVNTVPNDTKRITVEFKLNDKS